MDNLWQQFSESVAARIGDLLESRMRVFLSRFVKDQVEIIFSEPEAAAFLKVSKETLQCWRKRELIAYTRYPQAKSDELSGLYTYSLADLLNFTERYKINVNGAEVYRVSPAITLAGAEMRRAA